MLDNPNFNLKNSNGQICPVFAELTTRSDYLILVKIKSGLTQQVVEPRPALNPNGFSISPQG